MEKLKYLCRGAVFALLVSSASAATAATVVEAVTFAVKPGALYVPVEEAAQALGWRTLRDPEGSGLQFQPTAFSPKSAPVPPTSLRKLLDGTELIKVEDLQAAGAKLNRDPSGKLLNVGTSSRYFTVTVSPKRAEVNLAKQRLRAWQGKRLVLECRVSSGRRGTTPAGNFRAGPYKARRHFSSRYNNAPMPWSVQVTGHIFIHGFTSVPKYPASHGCIRLPLNEGNPARFFYEWIDKGTPIRVVRK